MTTQAQESGGGPAARIERVNRLIELFGDSVKHFFRDQQRSEMTSPLFNLPGRLVLGSHCYYENLPRLLARIRERATEAEIGQRMKRLCSRPNYIHLNSLMLGYLVGREQARLAGTPCADDVEQVCDVVEFWSRTGVSYRNDGLLLPDQADFSVPILPTAMIDELQSQLRADLAEDLRRRIRRMIATLELYTFILHGEARVGVFHHGPYPLEGGDAIIIKELVSLREDYYPWARLDARLPCDHLALVMRVRDLRSKIVLFGTLTTDPKDYASRIVAEQVFVVEDETFHPLPEPEVARLTTIAADAQQELYRRVIDWDDRYRIAYGAELYGCLLKAFADLIGFGDEFGDAIRSCFAHSVDKHLDDLHSGREQPWVLQHIATTDGPVFAPLDDHGGTAP